MFFSHMPLYLTSTGGSTRYDNIFAANSIVITVLHAIGSLENNRIAVRDAEFLNNACFDVEDHV